MSYSLSRVNKGSLGIGSEKNLATKCRTQHPLLGAAASFAKITSLNERSKGTGNTIVEGPLSDYARKTRKKLSVTLDFLRKF